MKRHLIISQIKILGLSNDWQKLAISDLSHRHGCSGKKDRVYERVLGHFKQPDIANPRGKFNSAVKDLAKWQLIKVLEKKSGERLYLEDSIWLQQGPVLQSIFIATLELSKNRRADISSNTILKEVRQKLRQHEVDLAYKTSKVLVPYVLYKRCKWRYDENNELRPPASSKSKKQETYEVQAELF